jgi:hypothetical protein
MTSLNSLSRASSSYLRSAMHQPIQWHEWGEEAFASAKREGKPILLDIGAVWCHWCHVMDRESYDDPEVAKIVNEHFIAVKVDRDERPDIDSRYQIAVSALTGQGGWPLTAFLTPDGRPFYGGTYFPPTNQYGRPSFRHVLLSIAQAYREKHGDVMEQAAQVTSAIAHAESFAGHNGKISAHIPDNIIASALKMFDERNGGFGSAPKFPHPSTLDLLVDQSARTGNEEVREMFISTLEHMARGGVYDQLAGGFHRYSVDERWIVPHFEKMSYDNSELLKNYVHGYQATGNPFFAEVARDIIRWMNEWLSDRERGGFYASQDADYSMDDDGDYFTWTLDETKAVLTPEEAEVACLYYDINEIGEMHHNPAKNVLFIRASVDEIARRVNADPQRVSELLTSAKKKMYAARLQRPTPYVDKTVYTGWNAMCISAYLAAARVLDLADARHFALRSLDRLLGEALSDSSSGGNKLKHVIAYSDPEAAHRDTPGVLDDYAFIVLACLDAYEATSDMSYFRFAQKIADSMISRFHDQSAGGFFDSAQGATLGILGTPRKPFQDSPTPAGNSVAAIALLRLYAYTMQLSYREIAERTLEIIVNAAARLGMFAASYGLAVSHFLQPHVQIVVIGTGQAADQLFQSATKDLSFTKAVLRFTANAVVAQNLPAALAETLPHLPALKGERPFAVFCACATCQPPVFEPSELRALMARDPAAA